MDVESGPFKDIGKGSAPAKFFEQLASDQKLAPPELTGIVVVSAHWETSGDVVHITGSEDPGLLYDYSGFPAHTYKLKWDAKGDKHLASHVQSLLTKSGISAKLDHDRGYDHGVFVPLMQAFPDITVPVIQVSILASLDPLDHIRMGEALAPLRKEGVLIVASGQATHGRSTPQQSKEFVKWLTDTVTDTDTHTDADTRRQQLIDYRKESPHNLITHRREEHLIPIHVAIGAAGSDQGKLLYDFYAMNGVMSLASYRFG
jgi:4,5-DOPA dioxygenase extradiol